jgi:hypothetical protein
MFVPLLNNDRPGLKICFDASTWAFGQTNTDLYEVLALYREPTGANRGAMVYGSFAVVGDYGSGINSSGKLTFQEMLEFETKTTRHHLRAAVKNGTKPYAANCFWGQGHRWDKALSASFLPLTQQADALYPNQTPNFTEWYVLVQ